RYAGAGRSFGGPPGGLAGWGLVGAGGGCRPGHAHLGRVIGKHLAQLPAPPVQAGHHGADRRAHDAGDFLVGEALDVGEVDREPVLPGAEDADEGGIRDADVVTRKGPAAGVAAGPWW